jgi:hypothetical protein
VKRELSIPRRIARAVFIGIGAIMLLLVLVPLLIDQEIRKDFLKFDFADPKFQALIWGVGTWMIAGILFLTIAVLIRRAGILGLSICLLLNAIALGVFWKSGQKEEVLLLPLGISLICLLVEETGLLRQFTRRTT